MSDEWYYAQNGQQQGPVPFAELKQLAKLRRLGPSDLIWREGMPNWGEAKETPGLFALPRAEGSANPRAAAPAAERLPVAVELSPPGKRSFDDDGEPRRRPLRLRSQRSMGAGTWAIIIGGTVAAILVIGLGVWAIVSLGRNREEQRHWSLGPMGKATYDIQFTAGKKVEIWVTSNQNTDVDLFVYDRNNTLVAQDVKVSKDCYVAFAPATTQTYRVEVLNLGRVFMGQGNGFNSGTLRYKESEKGTWQPPPPPVAQPRLELPNQIPPVQFPQAKRGQPRFQRPPQVIALQPGLGGTVIQGFLTAVDGRDPVMGSYCKIYTYPMKAGTQYVIDHQSTDFDAFLRLEDASGQQLAIDDDSGGNLNARIIFVPRQDGTYRIIATILGEPIPGRAGQFTLSIRP